MSLLDLLASAVLGETVHRIVLKLRESEKDPYKEALKLIMDDLKTKGYKKEIIHCLQNTLLNNIDTHTRDKIPDLLCEKCLIEYERVTHKPNEEEKKEIKEVCEYLYKNFSNTFSFTIKKDPRYELYKILTSITIPSIELSSYLDKECIHYNKPDLFKLEPKWIDFEKGHFIEREEKEKVLSSMEENNVHVIYGDPSSGKTHFVRYLGYLLLKENNDVYIIDLKEGKIGESYKRDLRILADRNRTVLIIDDAHLDTTGVDYIIGNVERKNLKLIISTRKLEKSQKEQSSHSLLKKYIGDKRFSTELKSIDIASRMVDLYSKLNRIRIPIKMKEKILSKYKKDLWFLKWALKVYEEEKTFSEKKLYEKIAEKRFYKYEYEHNKYLRNVGEIFYYISLFSQYEFPVERRFILNKIGDRKEDLDKLLESKEFIETENNRIMLHHSSVAKIYLETIYSGLYKEFSKEEKEKVDTFVEYFKEYPERGLELIGVLGSWQYREIHLINNLISELGIYKIKEAIDESNNLKTIGSCVFSIVRADETIGKTLVSMIDTYLLANKINESHELTAIGYCVSSIRWADETIGKTLVSKIDLSLLAKKIDKSNNLWAIENCVSSIRWADETIGKTLVSKIDLSLLAKKIDKSIDLRAIAFCVFSIVRADNTKGKTLVSKIDLSLLAKKIDESNDLGAIGYCVSSIRWTDPDIGKQLIELIKRKDIDFSKFF